jgi:hypothetical protein
MCKLAGFTDMDMPLLETAMKKWIVPIVAMLLTGCVSTATRTIDAQALSAVRNQSVVSTLRPVPDFSAMTATKVTFGIIGAAMMISEGNKIIAENKVADPADAIAAALTGAMRSSHGMQVVEQPLRLDSEEPERIAELAKGKARYVLDVRTTGWMFGYFPTDWIHYRVMYAVKARLIDVDARSVVAEAFCKRTPDSNTNAPTYDDMLAGGAARLKAELSAFGNACTESLGRDMLALNVSGMAPARIAGADARPAAAASILAPGAPAAGQSWRGVMACDARADGGKNPEAYEARFTVELQGNMVNLSRRTTHVAESLSGQITSERLELRGTGYRIGEQTRPWRLDFSGSFPPGATVYEGKGGLSSNGRKLRNCEMRMMRA